MHGLLRGRRSAALGGVPPDPPLTPGHEPVRGGQVLQGGRGRPTCVSHDPGGPLSDGRLMRGSGSLCGERPAAGSRHRTAFSSRTSTMHRQSGSSPTVSCCIQYCSKVLYSVLHRGTVFSTAARYCIQYCTEVLYSVLQ